MSRLEILPSDRGATAAGDKQAMNALVTAGTLPEALLKGAIDYARSRGARLLEAYPVDKRKRSNPLSMWFGGKPMYDRAGFKEVARRKKTRPVVRRRLRPQL